MATILQAAEVCDGFDVRVRLDDGTLCTFHLLQRPEDVEAAVIELIAQRAAQDAVETIQASSQH
jgi:hypothetical protein